MSERLLNSSDVAAILRVSPSALSNWQARQKTDSLPPADFYSGTDRNPLWRPDTIEAFVRAELGRAITELNKRCSG